MKCLFVFATILAVSAAQFGSFGSPFGRKPLAPRPPPQPFRSAPAPAPVAPARVASGDANAEIVRYDNEVNPDGSYSYYVETNNGIVAQAQGSPKSLGGNPPEIAEVAQGSFSWTSPEGQVVSISYSADENGYSPQGDSLPTPPPIPPQIARALEYIAKNPPSN